MTVKRVEIMLSGGNIINLQEGAASGFLNNIDSQGNFTKTVLVFNNGQGRTEEIIYTTHIAFIKLHY